MLHHLWIALVARDEDHGPPLFLPGVVDDVQAVEPELRDDPLDDLQQPRLRRQITDVHLLGPHATISVSAPASATIHCSIGSCPPLAAKCAHVLSRLVSPRSASGPACSTTTLRNSNSRAALPPPPA